MWLSEQIETIKQRDPAATSTLEVLLTYPGLHALIFHRASSALRNGLARCRAAGRRTLAAF